MTYTIKRIFTAAFICAALLISPQSWANNTPDTVKKASSFLFFNSMAHHNPAQNIRWRLTTELADYGFVPISTYYPHTHLWDYGTWNDEGCSGSSSHVTCDYAQELDEDQIREFAETLEDGQWVFLDIEFMPENLYHESLQYDANDEVIRGPDNLPLLDLEAGRAKLRDTAEKYERIVDIIKGIKPNVKIGNYGTGSANYLDLYESCIHWLPNSEASCRYKDEVFAEGMDIFLDYFAKADVILPSSYTHISNTDYQNGNSDTALEWRARWKERVVAQARHARQISQKLIDRGLKEEQTPVFFYMSPIFTTGSLIGNFLSPDHMQEQMDHVYALGDGIIFWGILRNAPSPDPDTQPSMHTALGFSMDKIQLGADWDYDNKMDLNDIATFMRLYQSDPIAADISYPYGDADPEDAHRFGAVFRDGYTFRNNPPYYPERGEPQDDNPDTNPIDPEDNEETNNKSSSSNDKNLDPTNRSSGSSVGITIR